MPMYFTHNAFTSDATDGQDYLIIVLLLKGAFELRCVFKGVVM